MIMKRMDDNEIREFKKRIRELQRKIPHFTISGNFMVDIETLQKQVKKLSEWMNF